MQNRDEIVAVVRDRGYMDGWTDEQLLARQVVKLAEEVAETLRDANLLLPDNASWHDWYGATIAAGDLRLRAWHLFDNGDCGIVGNRDGLISELADVYVVMSMLEHLLGVDIAQLALAKARGDVERGVR